MLRNGLKNAVGMDDIVAADLNPPFEYLICVRVPSERFILLLNYTKIGRSYGTCDVDYRILGGFKSAVTISSMPMAFLSPLRNVRK